MTPPPANQRLAVQFSDGCTKDYPVDIVYWFDNDGFVAGEAYFRRDDMCAPIKRGEFKHPYTGLEYRLHVPSRFGGKSTEAILDVLRWTEIGRKEPAKCAA